MHQAKFFLVIFVLLSLQSCNGSSSSKTPDEFGQELFKMLKSCDTKTALQYKQTKEDVEILAEKVPELRGYSSYLSDEGYLEGFKQECITLQGNPTIEYDTLELRKERIFGKGTAHYEDSYLIVLVDGKSPMRIRIEHIMLIDGRWRIFCFSC